MRTFPGDHTGSPLRIHVSKYGFYKGSHSVRTRHILLAFPKGKASLLRRFFLYPTKAELLREPYDVHKGLPQNANAVRFVGKRRRRRPKRRFFAGKPSNCAGRRRRVKAQSCRLNRATTQGRPYGSVFRNPRHLEKCFSARIIRAPGQASRLRVSYIGRSM